MDQSTVTTYNEVHRLEYGHYLGYGKAIIRPEYSNYLDLCTADSRPEYSKHVG